MVKRQLVPYIGDAICEIPYKTDDLVLARVYATGQVPNGGYHSPKLEMIEDPGINDYVPFRLTVEPPEGRQIVTSAVRTVQVEDNMVRMNPARCNGVVVYGANGLVFAEYNALDNAPHRSDA